MGWVSSAVGFWETAQRNVRAQNPENLGLRSQPPQNPPLSMFVKTIPYQRLHPPRLHSFSSGFGFEERGGGGGAGASDKEYCSKYA